MVWIFKFHEELMQIFKGYIQGLLNDISNITETELQLMKNQITKYVREVHKNKNVLQI